MYDTDEYKYVARVDELKKQVRESGIGEGIVLDILELLEELIREMPKHRDHGQD